MKAIIPLAGRGTRLRPHTHRTPKPLMKVAGKPVMSYILDDLRELGITEIDIQGLFSGTGGLRLRRKLADQWEIESNLGVESGVDLYYIIELE